jgi:hypothetical protein
MVAEVLLVPRTTYVLSVCLSTPPWSSPKNYQFRRCRRSNLDQNLPRITNPVSDLTGDHSLVLCEFSKLRLRKSPYKFLNLYGRFCPYNPPYNPGHDTLPPNLHIEIFTQGKKTRRKSIEFRKPYRLTSRKLGLEISFRMQIWWQWVNKNDPSFRSERTVL